MTQYQKKQNLLRRLGALDFQEGKPIEAFADTGYAGERSRAAYNIGWREAKEEQLNKPDKVRGKTLDRKHLKVIKRETVEKMCTTCDRDLNAPLFDGCMCPECPHGFEPCL
jgi:autonomous glycyl radical cofactor GrcA